MWPVVWTNLSKAAQRRERQEWANEEPKLENPRKLRGIYLLDPEDKECPETIKNAGEKVRNPDGSSHAVQKEKSKSFELSGN